jgi:uncharacterized protein (DUF433 family)
MPTATDRITKTPGVCGGDACIGGTRITVWGLVAQRRLGATDAGIPLAIQGLTAADLEAAWEYAGANAEEIERALWENRAGGVDYPGGTVPIAVLVRGRQLGLSDEAIRAAFEPALPQAILDAAWDEYARRPAEIDRVMRDVLPRELVGG